MKKPSSPSGSTIVDNLILSFRRSFDLLFEARTSIGRGDKAAWSGNGWLVVVGAEVDGDWGDTGD